MRTPEKVLVVASGVFVGAGVFLLLRRRPQVPSGPVNVCELAPPTSAPPTSKRRLTQSEVTVDMSAQAAAIQRAHRTKPIGSEMPFQSGGRQYYGRIEWHCSKPGPWHRGVSLFA